MKTILVLLGCFLICGCTVKAVGDPKRPITIQAHVTLDIKGLQNTATNIEDYVSGETTKENLIKK
ncbi:MAG TPA: hypothetical protein VI749_02690 [Candidatus Omnitrophota bacterium]|nr:hypothetical protein [Candidatus Omnitrophota bacterium]